MANADRPRGFQPFGKVLRATAYVAGAACYPGDMLEMNTDGKVDPVSAAGDQPLGVALSYAAADGDYVLVCDDPQQIYVVQADETEINAQTLVGSAADIVITAGNTTYKTSRQELDSSDAAASGGPLVIIGIERRPNNAFGAQVDVLVRINDYQFNDGYNGLA